jgi:2-oxoglutarate/2-oxoacid ferredoxin oxidoreductase subunit beta
MTTLDFKNMDLVYEHPKSLSDTSKFYCPGCTHGTAHRLVAEVIDEMGLIDTTIGVASVGCSAFTYKYFNFDFIAAPHGRAPAMATGVKRVLPDKVVFTYQGDGDMISIGTGEIVAAAARGENITTIFINNANYGMTGGQMAPTSLPGMKTSTSQNGRDVEKMGYPVLASELLASQEGSSYIVRRSLHDPKNIRLAKKAIRMAFETQVRGLGFSMVELLSACPTNWHLSPTDASRWIEEKMIPCFPIGDYKVHPILNEIKI